MPVALPPTRQGIDPGKNTDARDKGVETTSVCNSLAQRLVWKVAEGGVIEYGHGALPFFNLGF